MSGSTSFIRSWWEVLELQELCEQSELKEQPELRELWEVLADM